MFLCLDMYKVDFTLRIGMLSCKLFAFLYFVFLGAGPIPYFTGDNCFVKFEML